MLSTISTDLMNRSEVIGALAELRQEWEQAGEGESLVNIEGSIGLLLMDLVIGLALERTEQLLVLGPGLHSELLSIEFATPTSGIEH